MIRSTLGGTLLTLTLALIAECQTVAHTVSHHVSTDSSDARLSIGVFAGAALPSGEYEDDFAAIGYDLGIRIAVARAGSPIGVHLDGEYMKTGAKDGVCGEADCSGRLLIGSLGVDLGIPIPVTVVRTYATAGVGVAHVRLKATETAMPASSGDGVFAWNVGAGVRLRIGEWTSFVEARYVRLASAEIGLGTFPNGPHQISLKPITLGLSFHPCWACADLGR